MRRPPTGKGGEQHTSTMFACLTLARFTFVCPNAPACRGGSGQRLPELGWCEELPTWGDILPLEELKHLRNCALRELKLMYEAEGKQALSGDLFRVRLQLLLEFEGSLEVSGMELCPTFTTFRHLTDGDCTIAHRGLTPGPAAS